MEPGAIVDLPEPQNVDGWKVRSMRYESVFCARYEQGLDSKSLRFNPPLSRRRQGHPRAAGRREDGSVRPHRARVSARRGRGQRRHALRGDVEPLRQWHDPGHDDRPRHGLPGGQLFHGSSPCSGSTPRGIHPSNRPCLASKTSFGIRKTCFGSRAGNPFPSPRASLSCPRSIFFPSRYR
jgi:hypothetical protein